MDTDVCIVGSGVAGALIAAELSKAGKSVVVLESGRRYDDTDPELYARARRGLKPWDWQDSQRDAFELESSYSSDFNRGRVKAVGGTTLDWNAYVPRLQPRDFKLRSLFGVAADWPVTYEELEPYMQRAEEEMGVAGGNAPEGPPRSKAYPLPAHRYSYADREFFIPAMEKLGLTWSPNPMAINSTPYDSRPACEAFTTCSPMCPIGARYSALVHIRKAERTGHARVLDRCPNASADIGSASGR